MRNSDFLASVLMLAIVVVFASQAAGMTWFGIVYPRAVLIAMGVISSGLLISVFVKKQWSVNDTHVSRPAVVVIALLLMAAWVALMEPLGFYVTSVTICGLVMLLIDPAARNVKSFSRSVVAMAIELGLFYIAFSTLLEVPLPRGILL